MVLLYGRAGRLTAKNGGFRRGQEPAFPPVVHEGRPVDGVGPVAGITDVLEVPPSLQPGRYVLGFRYDCEVRALHPRATHQESEESLLCDDIVCYRRQATAQVWSNCADIELVK
jgi:hypothetical protein